LLSRFKNLLVQVRCSRMILTFPWKCLHRDLSVAMFG